MRKSKSGLYYYKDKRAQIYKYHEGGQDSQGFFIDGYYTPLAPAPLWCYTSQLTQKQLYATHMFLNDETRLFVFNYRIAVEQYQILEYKGKWYEITRVDTTDDYNTELFVYVKNLNSAPDESAIKPYGYEP